MYPAAPPARWLLRSVLGLFLAVGTSVSSFAQVTETAARTVMAEGMVSVLRDGEPWALFAGNPVRVGETIVTGSDGFAELMLSDGGQFFVFPNSQVIFRKNPGSLLDLVDVFLGRVKFHLQRLTGGPARYRIFTPTAVISVRGTTFDVSVEGDETTTVWVEEGQVGVSHRLLPNNSEVPLGPGESLVVYPTIPLAKAGIDKAKLVRAADSVARTAAYIWSRIGGGGGTGGASPGGPPGGGLPGDEPAPEPPPPPPPGP